MSNEKFTQGEWEVEEKEMGCGSMFRYGFQVVCWEKHRRIAYMETGSLEDKEEMQSNAAMIAAAPKMYNRLKEVKRDFRALLFNPYISEHTKECIKVMIDHVEDDLKKARGEE